MNKHLNHVKKNVSLIQLALQGKKEPFGVNLSSKTIWFIHITKKIYIYIKWISLLTFLIYKHANNQTSKALFSGPRLKGSRHSVCDLESEENRRTLCSRGQILGNFWEGRHVISLSKMCTRYTKNGKKPLRKKCMNKQRVRWSKEMEVNVLSDGLRDISAVHLHKGVMGKYSRLTVTDNYSLEIVKHCPW